MIVEVIWGLEYGVASVAVDELVVAVDMLPIAIKPKRLGAITLIATN